MKKKSRKIFFQLTPGLSGHAWTGRNYSVGLVPIATENFTDKTAPKSNVFRQKKSNQWQQHLR